MFTYQKTKHTRARADAVATEYVLLMMKFNYQWVSESIKIRPNGKVLSLQWSSAVTEGYVCVVSPNLLESRVEELGGY